MHSKQSKKLGRLWAITIGLLTILTLKQKCSWKPANINSTLFSTTLNFAKHYAAQISHQIVAFFVMHWTLDVMRIGISISNLSILYVHSSQTVVNSSRVHSVNTCRYLWSFSFSSMFGWILYGRCFKLSRKIHQVMVFEKSISIPKRHSLGFSCALSWTAVMFSTDIKFLQFKFSWIH